jgi:hypothetical protein
MKPIPLAIALFTLMLLAAVPSRANVTNPIHVEIMGVSALASSVATTQTLADNGTELNTIAATFELGHAMELYAVLADNLSDGGASTSGFAMTLQYLTSTGTVTERRDYDDVRITGIDFPGYDATVRTPVQIVVKMRSTRLRTRTADGSSVGSSFGTARLSMLQSNYQLKVDELGATRVDRIGKFTLIPCAQQLCDSMTTLEISVVGTDTKAWRSWFERVSRDRTLVSAGSIVQLATDLKQVLLEIRTFDVQPLSYTDISTSTGTKARVVLKVGRVKPR